MTDNLAMYINFASLLDSCLIVSELLASVVQLDATLHFMPELVLHILYCIVNAVAVVKSMKPWWTVHARLQVTAESLVS